MDYFQLSVKEKTGKFMFTVIGKKREKNKKGKNNNSGSNYNDTKTGCNDNKSIIEVLF